MKRLYVRCTRGLATLPLVRQLTDSARHADAFGLHRWFASLLAIYDTEQMVTLDLPWWNVAATREVERYLNSRPDTRVFEYGAGASTAWLARRAAEVVSVEHDPAFIGAFRAMLGPLTNVTLMERAIAEQSEAYVGAIGEAGGQFDLVVIDGRHRASCLAAVAAYLKPDGMVLFDDSGRYRYRAAIESSGMVERHHFGRSFCVPYPDHTSLLIQGA